MSNSKKTQLEIRDASNLISRLRREVEKVRSEALMKIDKELRPVYGQISSLQSEIYSKQESIENERKNTALGIYKDHITGDFDETEISLQIRKLLVAKKMVPRKVLIFKNPETLNTHLRGRSAGSMGMYARNYGYGRRGTWEAGQSMTNERIRPVRNALRSVVGVPTTLGFVMDAHRFVSYYNQPEEASPLPFRHYMAAMKAGAWSFWITDESVAVLAPPKEIVKDDRFVHNENGPAIVWSDDSETWVYKGVRVKPEWIEDRSTITKETILEEKNAEVRRVLTELFGTEKLLKAIGSKIISQTKDRNKNLISLHSSLIRPGDSADPNTDPDQVLKMVEVVCPSTGNHYFLRVPPDMNDAKTAVAWTFGFDRWMSDSYDPQIET